MKLLSILLIAVCICTWTCFYVMYKQRQTIQELRSRSHWFYKVEITDINNELFYITGVISITNANEYQVKEEILKEVDKDFPDNLSVNVKAFKKVV